MEVAVFGQGPVSVRCLQVLHGLGVKTVAPHVASLWVSVHWPTIFTPEEISTPKDGILNLHNSLLPWNKGAHACTWAIADRTPHGATLHWIDDGIDTGPLFYQERLEILPDETADQLYKRTADLEVSVFTVGMKMILQGERRRLPQVGKGTFHRKKDFDRLARALTTSDCKVSRG